MEFALPKQPKVKIKQAPPDQRKIAVMPLSALRDKSLDNQAIRVLGLFASYANRAGITWVSSRRIAQELQVTPQAISRQLAKLKKKGYVEVVKRGYVGQRTDTIRIIFDPSIKTEDVVAMFSDDVKSPLMLKEEVKSMNDKTNQKVVKRKKDITKSNIVNQKVVDNKQEAMAVLASLKIERELNQADINAIYLAKDAELPIIDLIADLQNEYKMIRSEGLKEPENILGLTQRILMLRGL